MQQCGGAARHGRRLMFLSKITASGRDSVTGPPVMNLHDLPSTTIGFDDEAGRALAHLRAVLALVEGMAGIERSGPAAMDESALEASAAFALAYANAPSIARRRFDALTVEAASFAAVGLAALLRHRERTGRDCPPAAMRLAQEMRGAIGAITGVLGR